ncbi:MAG: isocitrate dehydrogenase (NADP(+)) [Elusimicrobia bacterium]|nr:MAG: isocitrate dehydrogenase (NADP(+)) [Elusimicrobiota bacterium]
MADYKKIKVPAEGTKITYENGEIVVPNDPIIPFFPGDGTGPDLWKAAQTVFDGAVAKAYGGKKKFVWMEVAAGLTALQWYDKDTVLPQETLDAFVDFKVSIKGPLTTPVGGFEFVCLTCSKEQDTREKCIQCESEWVTPRFRSVNVGIRQKLDLYACVRPIRWIEGVPCPVKHPEKLDIIIFRENTEDVYAGIEFQEGTEEQKKVYEFLTKVMGKSFRADSGIGIKPISITGTKRLIRMAIKYAIDHKKPSVTMVHKGNIQKFTEGAFRDWGYEVARDEFADVIVSEADLWEKHEGKMPEGKILLKDRIADMTFQQLLLRPEEYSVMVMPNLNGDYLSDAAVAQVGGLGVAPGANIGNEVAVFEATHGTAPKYTGQDKVNPGSLILSGVMMLEHLGWQKAADLTLKALTKTIADKTVTYDLHRQMEGATKLKCSEFGEAIVKNMDAVREVATA